MPYQIPTAGIENNAIVSSKIANDAVGVSEIISDGVRTDEIQNSAVTTAKIADSNITTAKINNSAVTTAKINDDAVTNAKIADDAVQTAQIQDAAVTLAKCETSLTNALVPINGIIMFSGTNAQIPSSFALCDGTNGTPDLRNRFVIGANSYSTGNSRWETTVTGSGTQTGGSKDAIVVDHGHTGSTNIIGDHSHGYNGGNLKSLAGDSPAQDDYANSGGTTSGAGAHNHTVTINNTGVSGTNANLPPYYALAFIMRTA